MATSSTDTPVATRKARRLPEPPVIAGTFSGFVTGVVVTLVLSGVLSHQSPTPIISTPLPMTVTPSPRVAASLYTRIHRLLVRQLGLAYPDNRKPRLLSLILAPAESAAANSSGYRSVSFVFRLDDNPLGKSWRLRTAKADVFEVLKALYTSRMPIYSVHLQGVFPLNGQHGVRDTTAIKAYMDHTTAIKIAWDHLERNQDNENHVWSLLSRLKVNSQFP